MASSSYRPASGREGSSPLRRAASFTLAIAAHILVIWLLLRLAPIDRKPPEDPPLSTFTLDAERPAAQAAAQATRRAVARSRSASSATPTRPPPPVPPVLTAEKAEWPAMLSDSFDLASVPKRGADDGEAARGDDGNRGDSVAAYGPGAGPGGERLYNADWQRRPTDAEINGYLRGSVPPDAWALIACRTVPDNRVENCRVLGESPVGSGLGRAMREAAWQFRILPPRLGGKRLMGAWVSIRISWDRSGPQAR